MFGYKIMILWFGKIVPIEEFSSFLGIENLFSSEEKAWAFLGNNHNSAFGMTCTVMKVFVGMKK